MVGFRLDAGSQGRGLDSRRSIVCSLCGTSRDPRPTRNGKSAESCLSPRRSAIGDGKSNELQVPAGRQDLQEQPTWLGLSETGNGRRTTPYADHSHRSRTGIETRRKLSNPVAWPGRTEWHSVPHVGPIRRPGPTWLGLSETGNGRGTTPSAGDSHRSRTGIETRRKFSNPAAWPGRTEWHSVPHVGPVRRPGPTWLGLSETENGHGTTLYADHSHRSRTGIETRRKLSNPVAWPGRTEWHSVPHVGPVRQPGPTWPGLSETRNGHGTTLSRRPFLPISNRHRDLSGTSQSGGMDRSECESRRDSPTCRVPSDPRPGREPLLTRIPTRLSRKSGANGKPNELVPAGRQDLQGPERFSGVFHFLVFIPQFSLKRRLTCPTTVY